MGVVHETSINPVCFTDVTAGNRLRMIPSTTCSGPQGNGIVGGNLVCAALCEEKNIAAPLLNEIIGAET